MMNTDDFYFQMILMPLQMLKIPYTVKKEGNLYNAYVDIKGFHKLFTSTLGRLTAIKQDENIIKLLPTGATSNISVKETDQGVHIDFGDFSQIELTDDKLVEKLRETYQERLGNEITVNRQGEYVVISCANPSKVFMNALKDKNSPFEFKDGKLTFKM